MSEPRKLPYAKPGQLKNRGSEQSRLIVILNRPSALDARFEGELTSIECAWGLDGVVRALVDEKRRAFIEAEVMQVSLALKAPLR